MTRKELVNVARMLAGSSLISIGLCACSYKQNQVLFEGSAGTKEMSSKSQTVYKIQPQDILQVRNLQNIKYIVDDIAGSSSGAQPASEVLGGQGYQVEGNGTVALPVLGRVEVGGLTRVEATMKIEDLYRKTVIKNPIIEVKLINLKVTVFGEVRSPGNYALVNDRTTLVEILGQAGGITERGNETQIKIVRGGPDDPQIYTLNLRQVSSLANPASILQNHDIIYVGQNKRAIRNDKLQNITTVMQPALLLMNTALIIFTLSNR